jgi:hypothetical protein
MHRLMLQITRHHRTCTSSSTSTVHGRRASAARSLDAFAIVTVTAVEAAVGEGGHVEVTRVLAVLVKPGKVHAAVTAIIIVNIIITARVAPTEHSHACLLS